MAADLNGFDVREGQQTKNNWGAGNRPPHALRVVGFTNNRPSLFGEIRSICANRTQRGDSPSHEIVRCLGQNLLEEASKKVAAHADKRSFVRKFRKAVKSAARLASHEGHRRATRASVRAKPQNARNLARTDSAAARAAWKCRARI